MLDNICTCANCGKEGNNDNMNICNKCKSVKYCNAACKKKHRTKHKKACERRVAELHEEVLFKDVEPEECPICMLPLPYQSHSSTFMTCCGKTICNGCIHAIKIGEGKDLCPFCRTPEPTSDGETNRMLKKVMDKGSGQAYSTLAGCYAEGRYGMPQDWEKANELWLKAGELGCADGYFNTGSCHGEGMGAVRDEKKSKYYYELAAMGGNLMARHHLGLSEYDAGNHKRAMKHLIIAARAGLKESLDNVKIGFMEGLVTKDEYASTLRACHERQKEMKSEQRDKVQVHGWLESRAAGYT